MPTQYHTLFMAPVQLEEGGVDPNRRSDLYQLWSSCLTLRSPYAILGVVDWDLQIQLQYYCQTQDAIPAKDAVGFCVGKFCVVLIDTGPCMEIFPLQMLLIPGIPQDETYLDRCPEWTAPMISCSRMVDAVHQISSDTVHILACFDLRTSIYRPGTITEAAAGIVEFLLRFYIPRSSRWMAFKVPNRTAQMNLTGELIGWCPADKCLAVMLSEATYLSIRRDPDAVKGDQPSSAPQTPSKRRRWGAEMKMEKGDKNVETANKDLILPSPSTMISEESVTLEE